VKISLTIFSGCWLVSCYLFYVLDHMYHSIAHIMKSVFTSELLFLDTFRKSIFVFIFVYCTTYCLPWQIVV